ncbi:MAG TPA: vWA domain-containing protein, partial [Tissierellaceae bacterium]|nr:vWA domain-containing protein [Tissierellaceae bacterium]
TRIAVVSFASGVTENIGFQDSSGKASLISAINGLNATGGTFIQAGIKKASALLDGSSASKKNIVLLGDGAATYSYKIDNPGDYLEYWKTEWFTEYHRTTSAVPENEFNYSNTVGNGTSDHTRFALGKYYRHGASSIAEAGFAKAKGYEIYTVALDAGIEGDWTLDGIADSGNAYTVDINNLENLTPIFQTIAGSISYAATNATITDPMGPMFSIPGIDATNYASKIHVNRGTLSWDNITETITWHLSTISEGNPATMWYIVEIDNSAVSEQVYPTNEHTYVDYTNALDDSARKTFPEPEVGIDAGTIKIHYYRVDSTGQPINSIGQSVTKGQAELKSFNFETDPPGPLSFNIDYEVTGPATVNIGGIDYQYNATGNVGNPNPDIIILTAANPSAHVWFAYEEVKNDGIVTISKVLKDPEGNIIEGDDREFTILLTGPEGYSESVVLKGGQTEDLTTLVYGDYTVSEDAPGFDVDIDNTEFTINAENKTKTITVTNTELVPELSIVKSGVLADLTKAVEAGDLINYTITVTNT